MAFGADLAKLDKDWNWGLGAPLPVRNHSSAFLFLAALSQAIREGGIFARKLVALKVRSPV